MFASYARVREDTYRIGRVCVDVTKYIESKRMHLLTLARANMNSGYYIHGRELSGTSYLHLYAQTGGIVTEAIGGKRRNFAGKRDCSDLRACNSGNQIFLSVETSSP